MTAWREVVSFAQAKALNSKTGLDDRISTYISNVQKLTLGERNRVYDALINQNRIADLLQCNCNCDTIANLPFRIQEPISDLFEFGFKLLTDLEIRDQHYYDIYHYIKAKVCPFCGLESFDAPGPPREALDHYLPESCYPFAAANLRNLIPMGNKCNSRHKLATDILWNKGVRRRSFDPYNPLPFTISLENSQLFARDYGSLPSWIIEFQPNTQEIETWNDVFHIRERYIKDMLDPSFRDWIGDYQDWHRRSKSSLASQKLEDSILNYIQLLEKIGYRDQAFLKAAVFRLFYNHVQQNNTRLIKILLGSITP